MIYIIFLSCLISFIELQAMLPNAKEQTINITCLDNEKTKMPVSIVVMSETLHNMIDDLGGIITNKNGTISITNIDNIIFPIPSFSCSTINDLSKIIKNIDTINIKDYSLKQLTDLNNASDYLDFAINPYVKNQLDKNIGGAIYQQCKDLSLSVLEQQVIATPPTGLNPGLAKIIFGDPAINKFKLELMKRALSLPDRKTELPTGGMGGATFSSNNKMLATIISSYNHNTMVTVSLFNDDGTISKSTENILQTPNFWMNSANFSSDGKKFIVGNKNHISIYEIDDTGTINNAPVQILDIKKYQPTDQVVSSRKKKQISLSKNGKLMASYDYYDLLLWHFNDHGLVEPTEPQVLLTTDDDTRIISPIKFNDDGSIFVVCKNQQNNNAILYIFNADGSISSESVINDDLSQVTFYSHDRKFAATDNVNNLHIYNFSDKDNISNYLLSAKVSTFMNNINIILNDTGIITQNESGNLILIDINGNSIINIAYSNYPAFVISPDNKKMVFEQFRNKYLLYTLLTPEEENTLNLIKSLDIKNIILIDKVLRKTEDLSSLNDDQIPNKIIDLLKAIGLKNQKKVLQKKKVRKKNK
jgi:hypothetical protein